MFQRLRKKELRRRESETAKGRVGETALVDGVDLMDGVDLVDLVDAVDGATAKAASLRTPIYVY